MRLEDLRIWAIEPVRTLIELRAVAAGYGLPTGGLLAQVRARVLAHIASQPDMNALVPPAVAAAVGAPTTPPVTPTPTTPVTPTTPAALDITTETLPEAEVGEAYAVTFEATGGSSPYRWSCLDLPSWVMLSRAGQMSGTPTRGDVGRRSINVTVRDSAGQRTTEAFDLVVEPTAGQPRQRRNPFAINPNSPLGRMLRR